MTKNNLIVVKFKSPFEAEPSLHQNMNNNIRTLSKLAALGATLVMAAGCHTDNFYQYPPLGGTGNNSQISVPMTTPPAEAIIHPAWNEDRTSLAAEKVYFDFDKSTIKSREQTKLKDVADFMKGNAQVSIRIEGNCDERGTEEFNRELGVRRATVSRDYLISLGIDSVRIQTLSRGKDNPAVTGESGMDRALNRRDEFVVLISNKAL